MTTTTHDWIGLATPVLLTLCIAGCGSDGGGIQPENRFTRAGVQTTNKPRVIKFTWEFDGTADHFIVQSNPDGASGYTQVDINGDGTVDSSDQLASDTTSVELSLPVHLTDFDAANFLIVAQDATGNEIASSSTINLLNYITETELIGYFKASHSGKNDLFGISVDLSANGHTLVVGAIGEDSNATGIDGNELDSSAVSAGAVYVFTQDNTGVWAQQAYIKASNTEQDDFFGYSVALSSDGDTLAVGTYEEDSNATGIDGNESDNSVASAGAVYVFTRDNTGTWAQQAYVKASNTEQEDFFGYRVALNADGDTLAVGAYGEDSNATGIDGDESDNSVQEAGAVYVFMRNESGTWSQQAYIKASDVRVIDSFGSSLSLSGSGDTLAVGAFGEDSNATGINGDQINIDARASGAVYVFIRDASGSWAQQAFIKASNTEEFDYFGHSTALSLDGRTLAVGAIFEDSKATGINGDEMDNSVSGAGAVYVFNQDSNGDWLQQAYIKASNPDPNDYFGYSITLSSDGDTLAVGAYGEDSETTGIDGEQFDNSVSDSGAVYVFIRDISGSWMQQAYVKASNFGGYFGESTALSADGNMLAVGAEHEDSSANGINGEQLDYAAQSSGAVYLY